MKDKTKLENVKKENKKLKKNNAKTRKNITEDLSKKICISIIIILIFIIGFATSSIFIGKNKQKLSKIKLANTKGIKASTTEEFDTTDWGTAPEMSEEKEFDGGKIRVKGIIESRSSSTLNIKFYISSDYCIKSVKCNNQTFTNTKVYENNNINTTSIEDDLNNQTSWMNIEVSYNCEYSTIENKEISAVVYMASGEVINITIPKDYLHMYNTPPTTPKIILSNTSKEIMDCEKLKITCESTDKENDDIISYEWQEKSNNDSEWQEGTSNNSIYSDTTYSIGEYTVRVRAKDEWGAYSDWSIPYTFDVIKTPDRENDSILGYAQIINEKNHIIDIGINNVEYTADCVIYNGDLKLDGTNNIDGIALSNKIYEVGDESDCATQTEYAKNMVILKVIGDLTINNGVTLKACKNSNGYGGPKGLLIYCTGKLTNNGTISMTKRGAKAEGQDVYLFQNKDGSYEYVPKEGGVGGASVYADWFRWASGNPGIARCK